MTNFVQRISRFDLVMLKTTKNVTYLSAPPGSKTTPDGIWSVAGILGTDLMVIKDQAIVRIPVTDVIKIRDYEEEVAAISKRLEKKDG